MIRTSDFPASLRDARRARLLAKISETLQDSELNEDAMKMLLSYVVVSNAVVMKNTPMTVTCVKDERWKPRFDLWRNLDLMLVFEPRRRPPRLRGTPSPPRIRAGGYSSAHWDRAQSGSKPRREVAIKMLFTVMLTMVTALYEAMEHKKPRNPTAMQLTARAMREVRRPTMQLQRIDDAAKRHDSVAHDLMTSGEGCFERELADHIAGQS